MATREKELIYTLQIEEVRPSDFVARAVAFPNLLALGASPAAGISTGMPSAVARSSSDGKQAVLQKPVERRSWASASVQPTMVVIGGSHPGLKHAPWMGSLSQPMRGRRAQPASLPRLWPTLT